VGQALADAAVQRVGRRLWAFLEARIDEERGSPTEDRSPEGTPGHPKGTDVQRSPTVRRRTQGYTQELVESYVLMPPRGHTKGSNPAEGTVVGTEVWPLLVGVLTGWYSGLVASPLGPLVVSLPLCPIFQLYLLSRSRTRHRCHRHRRTSNYRLLWLFLPPNTELVQRRPVRGQTRTGRLNHSKQPPYFYELRHCGRAAGAACPALGTVRLDGAPEPSTGVRPP
jgi:hypothetical protein